MCKSHDPNVNEPSPIIKFLGRKKVLKLNAFQVQFQRSERPNFVYPDVSSEQSQAREVWYYNSQIWSLPFQSMLFQI